MKFRPILFSTPMVLALLAGTKTQTRRKVKPSAYQKKYVLNTWPEEPTPEQWNEMAGAAAIAHLETGDECCPYGNVGDVLWVRESIQIVKRAGHVAYRFANDEVRVWEDERTDYGKGATVSVDWSKVKKTPSIHVPGKYCRLFLEITDIRVERLQEISPNDAWWEGVEGWDEDYTSEPGAVHGNYRNYLDNHDWFANPVDSYQSLWESINGKGSWESNPYVWAVSFKVIDKPADFPEMEKPAQK